MWVCNPLTLVLPDIRGIFGSCSLGGGTVYPLDGGIEELTETWPETVDWTRRVGWKDKTCWDGMVVWTWTEVTAVCTVVFDVMFEMKGPDVGITLEDQMGFWYNDEALGVLKTNWAKVV